MLNERLTLDALADGARRGDVLALLEFRRRMEESVAVTARSVMRRGGGSTPLAQRILLEARREDSDENRDVLAGRIARRITDSVVQRLRRTSAEVGVKETVCA